MAGLQKGVLRTFSEHLSRDPANAEIASLQPFDTISVLYNPKGRSCYVGKDIGLCSVLEPRSCFRLLGPSSGRELCIALHSSRYMAPLWADERKGSGWHYGYRQTNQIVLDEPRPKTFYVDWHRRLRFLINWVGADRISRT